MNLQEHNLVNLSTLLTLTAVQCSQQSDKGFLFASTCVTLRDIESAERSCFEFKLVQYTTAAILVALDLSSLLLTIYYVHAGHGTL